MTEQEVQEFHESYSAQVMSRNKAIRRYRERCGALAELLSTYAQRPTRPHPDNRTDMVYDVMNQLQEMASRSWWSADLEELSS